MSALGIWGEAVEAARRGESLGDPLDIQRHAQGQSQESKDESDGRRDALRVLAGRLPLWPLDRTVTEAYRRGWMDAASLGA